MKKTVKKVLASALTATFALTTLASCGGTEPAAGAGTTEPAANAEAPAAETKGGKILFMVSSASGAIYDFNLAYMDMWTKELGYTYEIIYGDGSNDPAGNLAAVKKAMTPDVVGLIAGQDGGISNILDEYPELFVVGYASDMASVYSEGGASASALTNPNFLGTIAGGYASGVDTGKMFAQEIIDKGYTKVAIAMFPGFAFPQYTIADQTIRAEIETYNATATAPIEITGTEATTLMFKPLDDTFFNEPENQDLDAVIGLCAGQSFIYPTLANAIGNGIADPDTKLLTVGFDNDPTLVADVGTGIVQALFCPNYENLFYSIAMIDNAIQGKQYEDFTQPEVLDGVYVRITSDEVMTNVENNSPLLNADMSKIAASMEVCKEYLTRYNPDATYADLKAFMASDIFSEKAYE